jgi:hypothetical protein
MLVEKNWSQLAVTRNRLIGAGICSAIAFGALMDIFFGHLVWWLGLGMTVCAAVPYLVQKWTDRGTDSGSGLV